MRDILGWDQHDEPNGLSLRVIETRNYIRAYEKLEQMKDDPDAEYESLPIYDLVREIGEESQADAARAEWDEIHAQQAAASQLTSQLT